MATKNFSKGNKKVMNAWAFYDWANSVYSLVIVSAIFPIFWSGLTTDDLGNDNVLFLGINFNNDSLISYITAIAFLVVAIISPILSGIADYAGNKKFFMQLFCYLGALSCIGLSFISLDHLFFGLLSYFLALIGFWASLVFYNSYLPDIANTDDQDKLSAKGFSLGYLGSVLLLIIALGLIEGYAFFGFETKELPTRISIGLVGVWWIAFSQYTYAYLPNFKNGNKITNNIIFNGFKELKFIWLQIKQNLALKRYLGAFFVYSMAVQTVLLVATYFGVEEITWENGDATLGLIISILLIQLVAILGAMLTSIIAKKAGNINTLIGINIIWLLICLYAFTVHTPIEFYITAAFVGLVIGAIQSLSRSTYSKLLPINSKDTTSYFSFYDVSEKIGIVIGMLLYGILGDITGSPRFSILFFVLFFLLGIIFLFRIPKKVA
ncbi:MFS transporter [Aquimarina agarivorans]|uniref:MFS transporter n=1 Tax=Aquimarina agarivorans TaxID=980584 RepID=UPI000248EB06|nr:MFS transporter [Aquimarina agarivorans]